MNDFESGSAYTLRELVSGNAAIAMMNRDTLLGVGLESESVHTGVTFTSFQIEVGTVFGVSVLHVNVFNTAVARVGGRLETWSADSALDTALSIVWHNGVVAR